MAAKKTLVPAKKQARTCLGADRTTALHLYRPYRDCGLRARVNGMVLTPVEELPEQGFRVYGCFRRLAEQALAA